VTRAVGRDAIFAACAILAGAAGLIATWGYVPKARHFPQAMSAIILLSGIGILLMGRATSRQAAAPVVQASAPGEVVPPRTEGAPDGGPDTPLPDPARAAEYVGMLRGALPFGAILVTWALAVSLGAGYLLPGFVAGILLMIVAGSRRVVPIVLGAGGTVLFCFTMFYIVFRTRIPETAAVKAFVAPLRDLF